MNKLTDSDLALLLEVARIALGNQQMFNHIADEADIDENELEDFCQKVNKLCNSDSSYLEEMNREVAERL